MHTMPPETIEKRRLVSEATTPASRFPSAGARRDLGELDPGDPAAHARPASAVSTIVERKDGADVVGRAGDGEQREAEPERLGEAEADDRDPPRRGGDADAEPLAPHVLAPSRRGAMASERACVRRGVQEAERPPRRRRSARRANAGKSALGMPKIIAFESTQEDPMISAACAERTGSPRRSCERSRARRPARGGSRQAAGGSRRATRRR